MGRSMPVLKGAQSPSSGQMLQAQSLPLDAERSLWRILRSSRMDGHRCRRQVPFGHYSAGFVCHDAGLTIEIDGGQHDRSSPDEAKRTRFLEDQGYRIRRFWNNEVLSNLEGVCATIARDLQRHPHPVPPPSRGGNALTIREYRSPPERGQKHAAADWRAGRQGGIARHLANAALISCRSPPPASGFTVRKPVRRDQASSKRSRFITLVHAATKSFTNFSRESAHA
jgi:very-short-patch-repair endonuclease